MAVSFTIDLEDPSERYAPDGRHVTMTKKLLALCDEFGCKATFFVVGNLAEASPNLIKEIAAKGHELACHSHAHVPLTEEDPLRFARETAEDKDRLEQLSGRPVLGFRAPRYSLVPESRWTLKILKELNFKYSSSIMPTTVSLFGYPGAPHTPFKWPNGLIEFPLPVVSVFEVNVPYLGGVYMYGAPFAFTKKSLAKALPQEVLWTYTHPYDFDVGEATLFLPHTAIWISLILRATRFMAEKKIRKLLKMGIAPPLGERLPEGDIPIFPKKRETQAANA